MEYEIIKIGIGIIILAIANYTEYKFLQDSIRKEIKKQNELLEKLINQMNKPKE